jgi:hypothetical protein
VPFPWQAHNYLALIAVLQNLLLWYPIVILTVLALPYALARRPVAVAILGSYTITGIVGYGLLEGNIDSAMRHRSQFGIMFVAFAGVALAELPVRSAQDG